MLNATMSVVTPDRSVVNHAITAISAPTPKRNSQYGPAPMR